MNRALIKEDVTGEYREAAAPGAGEITYEDGYRHKGHQAEIDMAGWLHSVFGGDLLLLKEAEKDSVKRPDYMWNRSLWELKSASSINGADKLLQYAIKQIQDNPGGVVLNMLEAVDMEALECQLTRRARRSKSSGFDLMILLKGELTKVLRYKK